MVEIREIGEGPARAVAIHVRLPGEGANLLVVRAEEGYLMCGYLNLAIAEEVGDAAALVTGVGTIDQFLNGRVAAVTTGARGRGVVAGMAVREALDRLGPGR